MTDRRSCLIGTALADQQPRRWTCPVVDSHYAGLPSVGQRWRARAQMTADYNRVNFNERTRQLRINLHPGLPVFPSSSVYHPTGWHGMAWYRMHRTGSGG